MSGAVLLFCIIQSIGVTDLTKLIDANAVEQAAKSGDGEALRSLLGSLLSTQEGKRLAESVRRMMEN